VKATLLYISSIAGSDVTSIESLDLSKREIDELDDLSPCVELKRLDLSNNILSDLEGISSNVGLALLNLSHNSLESLLQLSALQNLTVLNLSFNEIKMIDPLALSKLSKLRALMLNNNQIHQMEGFGKLSSLNTLALSHNFIEKIEGFKRLSKLKKLSLSDNKIRVIPSFSELTELIELKLASNLIMKIPESFMFNPSLKILDLRKNLLRDFKDLEPLKNLLKLKNLNLWGNPICTKENYKEEILKLLPQVKVLDGYSIQRKSRKRTRFTVNSKVNAKLEGEKKGGKDKEEEKIREEQTVVMDRNGTLANCKRFDLEDKNPHGKEKILAKNQRQSSEKEENHSEPKQHFETIPNKRKAQPYKKESGVLKIVNLSKPIQETNIEEALVNNDEQKLGLGERSSWLT